MDLMTSSSGSTTANNFSLNEKKEALKTLLKSADCIVTFTKKDGTERVMKCTLRESVAIPYEKKTDRTRDPKEDILPVWDLEADAWRSVTVSTIKTVEING